MNLQFFMIKLRDKNNDVRNFVLSCVWNSFCDSVGQGFIRRSVLISVRSKIVKVIPK